MFFFLAVGILLIADKDSTIVFRDNAYHRKSVAASLVQCVYVLEKDRQEQREGSDALALPWWAFFHIQLLRTLVVDVDASNIWLAGHSLGSAMAMLTRKLSLPWL